MIPVALESHNGEQFIEEQLVSIVNQSVPPEEIIISNEYPAHQSQATHPSLTSAPMSSWSGFGALRTVAHARQRALDRWRPLR